MAKFGDEFLDRTPSCGPERKIKLNFIQIKIFSIILTN